MPNPPLPSATPPTGPPGPGRPRPSPKGRYLTGVMGGLAASLALVLALVHLPFYPPPPAVHWMPVPDREQLLLEMLSEDEYGRPAFASPITIFTLPRAETQADVAIDDVPRETPLPAPERREPVLPQRLLTQRALDFAEVMPQIDGGLRQYYIHIEYPTEARDAGIEGRLMLEFIVETDGTTSDVRVLKSLHPLLDSSAVRALRRTRFVPGKHKGELIPVRMRLPVRFRLVDRPALPPTALKELQ